MFMSRVYVNSTFSSDLVLPGNNATPTGYPSKCPKLLQEKEQEPGIGDNSRWTRHVASGPALLTPPLSQDFPQNFAPIPRNW